MLIRISNVLTKMHDSISVNRGKGIPWFANVHITRYQNLTHDIRREATLQKNERTSMGEPTKAIILVL